MITARYIIAGLGAAAMLGLYGSAIAAAPKIRTTPKVPQSTQDNFRSCKTLLRCVDILERHAADSFDYAVLARDFDRHGDKAREVLWRIVDIRLAKQSPSI